MVDSLHQQMLLSCIYRNEILVLQVLVNAGYITSKRHIYYSILVTLTLTVLVATIDAQWEGMGDVGSARYEPALLPPCPTIRVLSYSN